MVQHCMGNLLDSFSGFVLLPFMTSSFLCESGSSRDLSYTERHTHQRMLPHQLEKKARKTANSFPCKITGIAWKVPLRNTVRWRWPSQLSSVPSGRCRSSRAWTGSCCRRLFPALCVSRRDTRTSLRGLLPRCRPYGRLLHGRRNAASRCQTIVLEFAWTPVHLQQTLLVASVSAYRLRTYFVWTHPQSLWFLDLVSYAVIVYCMYGRSYEAA